MASLLFPGDERSVQPLLIPPPPDERGPLAPDPRADALGQTYQVIVDLIAAEQAKAQAQGLWEGGQVWEGGHPTRGGLLDAARQTAEGVAMGTTSSGGGPPGFTAYHGSPHKFPPTPRNPLGEFDPAKIGTGEGAQAYGVGAGYLAEREGIAKGYRDALTNKHQPPDMVATQDALLQEIGTSNDKAAALTAKGFDYDSPEIRAAIAPHERNIKALQDKLSAMPKPTGHMYEVRVHADPERFLHWDKPLSEQHPDVQKFFRDQGFSDPRMRNPGSTAYGALSLDKNMKMTRAADVSAALQKAGIPGIRYLDQGSRGAGEGSHNAVVFDAATMEIIRRYGLAGLMLGGGGLLSPNQQEQ